ncbi:cytochrome c oxidase subunit VA-domain-containing protein [Cytidiella melzeri]|nr:cytochrome c oxidase subunit VA-domain-containing protein [Cytidiella melzeri]
MLRSRVLPTLARARPAVVRASPTFARFSSSEHGQETFESFTERYVNFFQSAQDLFEVQRGLNNCFAHDLVPAPSVIEAALRASRRVNDYATAVRVFEGVKEKVENKQQYQAYLEELKGVREELGMNTCIGSQTQRANCYITLPRRNQHSRGAVQLLIIYRWHHIEYEYVFKSSTASNTRNADE